MRRRHGVCSREPFARRYPGERPESSALTRSHRMQGFAPARRGRLSRRRLGACRSAANHTLRAGPFSQWVVEATDGRHPSPFEHLPTCRFSDLPRRVSRVESALTTVENTTIFVATGTTARGHGADYSTIEGAWPASTLASPSPTAQSASCVREVS